LEFFFPIGVGHLYAGRIFVGVLKMCLVILLPCVIVCIVAGCVAGGGDSSALMAGVCGYCTTVIVFIGVSIWTLVDLICFGINYYLDGNGVPLRGW